MKIVYSLISVFFLVSGNPTKRVLGDIKLDDKYIVEGTFSGNTSGDDSFHLIIAENKDSNAYDIIPYVYSAEQITELKVISFKKMPEVLSFHNTDNQLSLITKVWAEKKEVFNIIDINIGSGDFIKSTDLDTENFKTVIRKKDRNLLLFSTKKSIKVIDIKSAQNFSSIEAIPNASAKDLFKFLSRSNIDAINTDEFVANGSISRFRAYSESDKVTITQEDYSKRSTNSLQIPLNGDVTVTLGVDAHQNSIQKQKKIKKSTSYVKNDKLYQLKTGRSVSHLDIYDLEEGSIKHIDMMALNPSNVAKDFDGIDGFLKQASKNENEPTVTINSTKAETLKVRVDYVNKNAYNYRYNWWWHHHWYHYWHMEQMMLFRQQHIRANIPRFGPNGQDDYFFTKKTKSFFEITINLNDEVLEDDLSGLQFKEIDTKSYIKRLDENKQLEHTSTVFTDSKFRYIAYNIETKSFAILEEVLND